MSRTRQIHHSNGMTLVDVVVAILLLTLFAGAALPAVVGKSNEAANRVNCAKNLELIANGLLLYANEVNGAYPRTGFDLKANKITAYTGADSKSPFAKDTKVEANDVTAPLFLLLRTGDLPPKALVCPSSGKQPLDPEKYSLLEHSNFANAESLSYSMQVPYPNPEAIKAGFRWTNTLKLEVIVAADMNPGAEILTKLTPLSPPAELRKGNSLHHNGDGQNILCGDMHVEFVDNPFCGFNDDNFYTYGPSGKGQKTGGLGFLSQPITSNDDSLVLPTVLQK
jgi:type II secretory pathway pseudopilin PulG